MAHPSIGEGELQRALQALDQCLQDHAWQPGDNYLDREALYVDLHGRGITLTVIATLVGRLIEQNVFRPYCQVIPAGYSIEQGMQVFRSEAEFTPFLITTRERWHHYLAETMRATTQSAVTARTDAGNPYRQLLQLALQIHEEELQQAGRLANGQRQSLHEWEQHLRQREEQVQRLIDAGLRAADRTGLDVAEVERRLLGLAGPLRAILLWRRDARGSSSYQREPSTRDHDAEADYLSRHYRQMMEVWESVHTLAVRLEGERPPTGTDGQVTLEPAEEESQAGATSYGSGGSTPCRSLHAANEAELSPPPRPAASPTTDADGEFLDFPRKQRALLLALRGKDRVPIAEVMRAVYGKKPTQMSTLERLVGRTNQSLTTRDYHLEIKRKANTLSLQPV